MKTTILIILLINLQNLFYPQQRKEIIIKFVDFNIETPIRVSCERFEKAFHEISEVQINGSSFSIFNKKFKKIFNKLKIADYHVDTRGKIEIMNNNCKQVYCFNESLISYNGKVYLMSKDLLNLLNHSIKKNNKREQK